MRITVLSLNLQKKVLSDLSPLYSKWLNMYFKIIESYLLWIFCKSIKSILDFLIAILLVFIYFLMNLDWMRLAPDSHLEVTLEDLFGHCIFWSWEWGVSFVFYCSAYKLLCGGGEKERKKASERVPKVDQGGWVAFWAQGVVCDLVRSPERL